MKKVISEMRLGYMKRKYVPKATIMSAATDVTTSNPFVSPFIACMRLLLSVGRCQRAALAFINTKRWEPAAITEKMTIPN